LQFEGLLLPLSSLSRDVINTKHLAVSSSARHIPSTFPLPYRMPFCARLQLTCDLGTGYKHGAGTLDIQHVDANTVISAGYDTYIRMFDLRASFR